MVETPTPEASSRQKFYGIDVIRGVATCFVASAHGSWLVAEQRYYGTYPFAGILNGVFVTVDFFFVLSGFLITWVHWRDIGRVDRIANYFKRRLARIYPVYWIVLTIVIVAHLFHPKVTSPVPLTLESIVTSYLVVPTGTKTILGVAWTLYYEIFCYIVFGLILLMGRTGFALVSLWAGAIVWFYLTDLPKEFPYSFYLNPYNLEFLIGIGAAAFARRYTLPAPLMCAAAASLAYLSLMVVDPHDIFSSNPLYMRCTFGLLASVVILGFLDAERSGRLVIPRWMQDFGAASYSIYLVHSVVQPPFIEYGWRFFSHWSPEVVTILCVAFSILVGYVFHRLVELPVTALVKTLLTDRKPARMSALPS